MFSLSGVFPPQLSAPACLVQLISPTRLFSDASSEPHVSFLHLCHHNTDGVIYSTLNICVTFPHVVCHHYTICALFPPVVCHYYTFSVIFPQIVCHRYTICVIFSQLLSSHHNLCNPYVNPIQSVRLLSSLINKTSSYIYGKRCKYIESSGQAIPEILLSAYTCKKKKRMNNIKANITR